MARGDRSGALQKKFKKSVSKARSRGIDSRPRYQNIDNRVKEQTKGIKDILNRPKDDFSGGRDNYRAAQSGINSLSNLLKEQQENTLRNSIASSFGKGVVDKSNFLGHAGDKTFLGINYGSTPTVAASTINPFSGETIETIKAREGLTSPQYNEFLDSLGEINPDLAYETFMPEGAKFLNKAAEAMAPFPLKVLASTMEGGKNIADYFTDKGSRVGSDITDQLKRYYEGIRSLNPLEEKEPLMSLKKEDGPTGNYFDTSKGFPNINTAFMPVIGETPEQTFARATNRVNFNQGGLASLNNQDYGMLMGASNFGF
jgi:hypothetical protein